MNIEKINLMDFSSSLNTMNLSEKPEIKTQASFSHLLTDMVSTTNNDLLAADSALQNLARGDGLSLHETMLTLEQAKISFQFLEQVRNRLMSAYQDILREPI